MPGVAHLQFGDHLAAGVGAAERRVGLREKQSGREAPRSGGLRGQGRNRLLHSRDGRGKLSARQLHGAGQHVGHSPRQILAWGGNPDDVGGPLLGDGEIARGDQCPDLPEGHQVPQQPFSLVVQGAPSFGDRGDLVPASHQPEGESTAEDRPLHRGGRRCGVGKDAAGEVGGLDQSVFEHQRRRSESVHDQTEHGVGDPAAQQVDHLVGGVGVAHGPVQIGDARGTPTHQIDLTELIGIEGGEHVFGLRGIALPQEGATQKHAAPQAGAAVDCRARQPFAESDVAEGDGVTRGADEQVDVRALHRCRG